MLTNKETYVFVYASLHIAHKLHVLFGHHSEFIYL